MEWLAREADRVMLLRAEAAVLLKQRGHDVQVIHGEATQNQHMQERHRTAQREWTEIKALMRARATLPVLPEDQSRGRGWTREEIYDERYDITAR